MANRRNFLKLLGLAPAVAVLPAVPNILTAIPEGSYNRSGSDAVAQDALPYDRIQNHGNPHAVTCKVAYSSEHFDPQAGTSCNCVMTPERTLQAIRHALKS